PTSCSVLQKCSASAGGPTKRPPGRNSQSSSSSRRATSSPPTRLGRSCSSDHGSGSTESPRLSVLHGSRLQARGPPPPSGDCAVICVHLLSEAHFTTERQRRPQRRPTDC